MYNCDFFGCFRTYLSVRALLAKIVKLRRYRKPVQNLWSRFELDPSTVARVAGAQSFFFFPGVDKTISRSFSETLFYFHRAYDFFLFLRRDHDSATAAAAVAVHRACNNRLQRYNATAPSSRQHHARLLLSLFCFVRHKTQMHVTAHNGSASAKSTLQPASQSRPAAAGNAMHVW